MSEVEKGIEQLVEIASKAKKVLNFVRDSGLTEEEIDYFVIMYLTEIYVRKGEKAINTLLDIVKLIAKIYQSLK
jgi:hypothetical protein